MSCRIGILIIYSHIDGVSRTCVLIYLLSLLFILLPVKMVNLTCWPELTDNSIQIKKDLEMFLYQLRIEAEVHVEEMVGLFKRAVNRYMILSEIEN